MHPNDHRGSSRFNIFSSTIAMSHFTHRPESGEPSPYETRPFFPGGLLLPDDDLDLALLAGLGDWESNEDLDSDGLIEGDLRFSARGEGRYLDVSIGERLRTGLRLFRRLR